MGAFLVGATVSAGREGVNRRERRGGEKRFVAANGAAALGSRRAMEPADGILVTTFARMTDAEVAASLLRGAGIECVVTSDDCGGMYPPLSAIKLLVPPGSLGAARELLRQTAASSQAETVPNPASSTPLPRVLRFNAGLLVGLVLGAMVHHGWRHYDETRNGVRRYDHDLDGRVDEEWTMRSGKTVGWRSDRNDDGRWDEWVAYSNGIPVLHEFDDNFDGKPDLVVTYATNGRLFTSSKADMDFNETPDHFLTYSNGLVAQIDCRPNGTNIVLRREFYRHGVLQEELHDVNGDGRFDLRIQFDAFQNPVTTNQLNAINTTR
jgi:hypothetical protein